MEISEIRQAALILLLEEDIGPTRGRKARLAERIGKSPAQVSQWLSGYRTIEESTAREIERKANKPARWMDEAAQSASTPAQGVDHLMSFTAVTMPPITKWEDLLSLSELPPMFTVAMPDDALAGVVARGTELVFEKLGDQLRLGNIILIEDPQGRRHIRRFGQGVAEDWVAQATNPAYANFYSDRDNVKVVARVRYIGC